MNEELMAGLDVMGYGYEVTVIINGINVGIKGGKSESLRLFGSTTANKLPPNMKNLACLKEGQNGIVVKYRKLPDEKTPKLTIDLCTEEQFQKGEHLFFLEGSEKDLEEIKETFTLP